MDKLNIPNISLELVGMIFALPLLPWYKFEQGFDALKEKVNESGTQDQAKLNILLNYIKRNWIKNAKIVSVYNAPNRTNNYIESANRYLRRKFGVRSNLWTFIGT